jgi:predicted metal-dependent phosphoesterase TrpH
MCYEDHLTPEANLCTTPNDIIEAAAAAGLDAIAITDHNTAEGIDCIREAASKNGLCVFPGVELTTRHGHVLAIFEPTTPVLTLREMLRELGFREEQGGYGYFQTDYWMDQVFEKINEHGGLAIAAHIDRQPRGFIASTEAREDKIRIHSSNHLDALEITAPGDKLTWNEGRVPHFSKPYACIQGSDAHAPAEIGRRPVYLGISRLDMGGLRLALDEHQTRIRFPHELTMETQGSSGWRK